MSLILSGTDGLSDVDGTAATPAIRGADANTGIFFPAADTVAASTGGTERLRLNSSGNLGLGVTPSAWDLGKAIEVGTVGNSIWGVGSSNMVIGSNIYYASSSYKYANTAAASAYQQAGGVHYWYNAASGTAGNTISFTQAMTLDASGRLGVNTTSPGFKLTVGGYSNVNSENKLAIGDNADYQGRLYIESANEVFTLENTSDYANGAINFRINGSERARITSAGYLLVGTTSVGGDARLVVNNPDNVSGDFCFITLLGSNCSNTSSYHYIATTGSADKFYVYGNGNVVNTNGSYGTLSDVKLKENIVDATPKLADVMRLQVRNFNLKTEPGHKQIGFVAQEFEQVFPAMVDESPDRDEEGNQLETTTKHIKTSVLVPILVKAIQEQQAIIESLTARITALEAK